MAASDDQLIGRLRVGQAAEMLGVSVETLRRWEAEGRLRMDRSEGGQRVVDVAEITRLLAERRKDNPQIPQNTPNFPLDNLLQLAIYL